MLRVSPPELELVIVNSEPQQEGAIEKAKGVASQCEATAETVS